MLKIKQWLYRVIGLDQWTATPDRETRRFVWRRYDAATDSWQSREMTQKEDDQASLEWSVR